ncbi:hypothetical protein KCU73_g57, partial [Aureobasidium melanogenum]
MISLTSCSTLQEAILPSFCLVLTDSCKTPVDRTNSSHSLAFPSLCSFSCPKSLFPLLRARLAIPPFPTLPPANPKYEDCILHRFPLLLPNLTVCPTHCDTLCFSLLLGLLVQVECLWVDRLLLRYQRPRKKIQSRREVRGMLRGRDAGSGVSLCLVRLLTLNCHCAGVGLYCYCDGFGGESGGVLQMLELGDAGGDGKLGSKSSMNEACGRRIGIDSKGERMRSVRAAARAYGELLSSSSEE